MELSQMQNAIRILFDFLVLWSLIFVLMSKLRIPDRFLEGLPMEGRNIIVVGLILCIVSVQLIFNSHWRAFFDSRWWSYRADWYIMTFLALKLLDSMRVHTKASKAAAQERAAEREERRRQSKKEGPTPKRKKGEDSRRFLG